MVARTGIGVAGLPLFMDEPDPALQRLPYESEPFYCDLWLVVHADLRHSPRGRAVIDFIAETGSQAFGPAPYSG
ncbi:hypothetical protein [Pseudomonas sp. RIT-PI-S]|uniref:hypothetical protein n=1 Tax=Pseudomonas sp. RIT-PI-S TaxID=3035295 RepID=UPI0021D96B09|nr:hypothetical protein [Pseudomonas sp. RIT-PI-S]